MEIALLLALLGLILVLFPLEIVSVDILALGGLLVLIAFRILPADQAFASFGSEMMVLLGSIFVIAGALMKTGVLDEVGLFLFRHSGGRYPLFLASMMAVVAIVSAFMNNTVVTAVFIPPVLAVARRAHFPPSKLLMPVAFAAMLGGCCTLIGTSTNVAASNFLVRQGMPSFGLFEFLPVGIVLIVSGIAYFLTVGEGLLPSYQESDLTKSYHVKEYLTEIALRAGCPYIGLRLDKCALDEIGDVTVLGVFRGKEAMLAPEGHEVLALSDTLLLEAQVEGIQRLRQVAGIEIKGDLHLGDRSLESERVKLVEVIIGPGSRFAGRSLKEIDFRRRYGMTALALSRQGGDPVQKVGKIPLMVGDLLLVQGPEDRLDALRSVGNVLVLTDFSHFLLERKKGIYVASFFGLAVVLGFTGILPLGAAMLAAALMTVLVRAIPGEEVYRLIDWRLMMMIGAMTAFGQAMVHTGADKFLASIILKGVGQFGPTAVLGGFFVLTVLLTQPLSNAAAALAVLPIAIATAEKLGANPRAFAVTVTLAASASFLTPLEPSCVLVYPVGRYRFIDFVKVGFGLTIVMMIVVLVMVPLIWKL